MLPGRLDQVAVLREGIARIVGRYGIEDMLSDPALRLHEELIRNADRSITPCGFGLSSLPHPKRPVGFDLAEDDVLKEFRRNVAKVAEVVESQHHWEIG